MEFLKICLYNKNNKELLIKKINKLYFFETTIKNKYDKLNNIIDSLINYHEYEKYKINVKKYNECCKYFINILYYNNRDINNDDFINFNIFKVNDIILCKNYKDIVYLFEIIIYTIIIKQEGFIKISYEIPLYDNKDEKIYIQKKELINRKYPLKIHSYNSNFLVIFQCYVISAINMIIQNSAFDNEIMNNPFTESITSTNFYKGGNNILVKSLYEFSGGNNNEMINAFQECLNNNDGKCLKIIKTKLNMLTNNKYIFGLSPIKIYPHVLVNDLLYCLSPMLFTNDCKIIYNNNKYSFIYDLHKNIQYYNDILNNNEIDYKSFNLYDELINDINFKNINTYPKHLYISTTLYDPNIYKMLFFTNDIYNNKYNEIINKYNIINTFQRNIILYKYIFLSYKYELNKLIIFDNNKNHFYMIKIKNNEILKYDSDLIKLTKNNINNNYKINSIYCDDNNIYDNIKYYKIVMVQYELL